MNPGDPRSPFKLVTKIKFKVRETGEIIEVEIRDGLIPPNVDSEGWVIDALERKAHKEFTTTTLKSLKNKLQNKPTCQHLNKKILSYGSFCDDCGNRIR